MPLVAVLQRLMAGHDLDRGEARLLMSLLADGQAPAEQVAGVLVALQMKGASPDELAGFADVLRERAHSLASEHEDLVDTCGTGGGRTTFNLSTGAAIVAAAAGAKIAKHGNRSVTSHCGSADVLEALGVRLTAEPEHLIQQLEETNLVFLFAPHHHPSMKALAPVRKALGVRTVFNQLGPLANPAGARRQLIGVYSKDLIAPMAEALVLLGVERAFVVHSHDGLDEVSPCVPTDYASVKGSRIDFGVFKPTDFGVHDLSQSALDCGASIEDNAKILYSALDGTSPERTEALVPNAAVALVLSGISENFSEAAVLARSAVKEGLAVAKLGQLVEESGL